MHLRIKWVLMSETDIPQEPAQDEIKAQLICAEYFDKCDHLGVTLCSSAQTAPPEQVVTETTYLTHP